MPMGILPGYEVNQDPHRSTQPCGCDPAAHHHAQDCKKHKMINGRLVEVWVETTAVDEMPPLTFGEEEALRARLNGTAVVPDVKQWRKERPLYSGVLAYFPDALLEVAYVSFIGNEQHNPGEPLHWSRGKSADHLDCVIRHAMDHSKTPEDTDGAYHLAKAAWRALAELQIFLEKEIA